MCSAFTPDCGYNNSTIILLGDVFCPNTKCSGRLYPHKKTFQSRATSDYQCSQYGSVCQVRNIPFEDQTNSFFLSLRQGVFIFEESPKSVQDALGDVHCPDRYCSNKEKCESLAGYVTTLKSKYACGECGAWFFFTKFFLCYKSTLKQQKQTKYAFSLLKKDELGTQQTTNT